MATRHDIPANANVHPSAIGTMTRPDTQLDDAHHHHSPDSSKPGLAHPKTVQDAHNHSISNPHPEAPARDDEHTADKMDKSESEGGYPEQRHAGKVGYGPNYHQGPRASDKIQGFKEQIKGKLTRNHDLEVKGHDRVTGELKKKEEEEDDRSNPFKTVDQEDEKEDSGSSATAEKTDQQTKATTA